MERLNGYDTNLMKAQDFEFWRRCREQGFQFHNRKSFDIDYRLKVKSFNINMANKLLLASLKIAIKHKDYFLLMYAFMFFKIYFLLNFYKPKVLGYKFRIYFLLILISKLFYICS